MGNAPSRFHINLEFIPGHKNIEADVLSRSPLEIPACCVFSKCEIEDKPTNIPKEKWENLLKDTASLLESIQDSENQEIQDSPQVVKIMPQALSSNLTMLATPKSNNSNGQEIAKVFISHSSTEFDKPNSIKPIFALNARLPLSEKIYIHQADDEEIQEKISTLSDKRSAGYSHVRKRYCVNKNGILFGYTIATTLLV